MIKFSDPDRWPVCQPRDMLRPMDLNAVINNDVLENLGLTVLNSCSYDCTQRVFDATASLGSIDIKGSFLEVTASGER